MSKCECKECLHYDVCGKQKITNHTISKSVCKHFKDKSLFVELPCDKQIKEMAMVATQMMVDEIRIQIAKHTNGHLPLFPSTEEEFTKYIEQFIEVFKKFEF